MASEGGKSKMKVKLASVGAVGFLTILIAVAALLFSSGNLIPTAFSQRLLEETDVQYADLVESKKLVIQQALRDGDIPGDTAEILKKRGFIVGYVGEDGQFVEANKAEQELAIQHGEEIITADDFITKMSTDTALYAAIQEATYDRAAAYYDESAMEVMDKIGTKRNNFSKSESFEETMKRVMGDGSSVNVSNVQLTTETKTDENGNKTTTQSVSEIGNSASSRGDASKFIEDVRLQNPANSAEESAMNAADALKVADQLSQEQRSSLFYALMQENISKMKAGDGNDSQINDTMNFLTRKVETEVVDTQTGQVVKVSGSALEAPSLYAILAGEKVDKSKVGNYSAERVLKTIQNRAAANNGYSPVDGTVASADEKVKGSIGRLLNGGTEMIDTETMQTVEPTINGSLIENGADSLQGIVAGEYLASGAVNLGRMLARQSGATPGDDAAVVAYARLNEAVLAMEAKVDRANRSPLDITSKNTFLGSIVHKFALAQLKNPELRNLGSMIRNFGSVMGSSVQGLLPKSLAAATDKYMTDFGQCETAGNVGAAATASCWEVATFDPSTLVDTFNDPGFQKFVENNTELDSSGTRRVLPDSKLADFISYLVARETPIGVMDGGILESMMNGGGDIPFLSDILGMIANFLGANEEQLRTASGEVFVNKAGNADWEEMKYAQRYVALARATEMLREHSSDQSAYQNMKYFEGNENPVIAFLRTYEESIAKSK